MAERWPFGSPGFSKQEQAARKAALKAWRPSGSVAAGTAAPPPATSVPASNASARTTSSSTSTTTSPPSPAAPESPSIVTNRPLEVPPGVRDASLFPSNRLFHLNQPQHVTRSTSSEPTQVKMSSSDSSDSSYTADELSPQHGETQGAAGDRNSTAESVTSSSPTSLPLAPIHFTADHATIQIPAAAFISANANFFDINACAHNIPNGVHGPGVQAQVDNIQFFQVAPHVAMPSQSAPVQHAKVPPVTMPPQAAPAQHAHITPPQDGLPAEAMATATWNPYLRMYTAHWDWHLITGLDTQLLCSGDMMQRLRYLFDFMATTNGGRAFAERISHNIRIGRATLANANDHVTHDEYQINVLDGVPVDHNIQAPQHGAISLTAGRQAIVNKLANDRHWQHIFGIEVRLSEVALERVEVARKATALLADIYHHVPLSQERTQELQDLFGEFQDKREEAIGLFREVTNILGWGAACASMVQRHRNEVWDIWGGAPASAVAHLL